MRRDGGIARHTGLKILRAQAHEGWTPSPGMIYYGHMNLTPQTIKRKITPILKRQGVTKAALFGSVVRGELKKTSDIDVLVQFKPGKSLFDLVGLKLDLEARLKRKVDLVTYNSLHPFLRDRILQEQQIIYGKRS